MCKMYLSNFEVTLASLWAAQADLGSGRKEELVHVGAHPPPPCRAEPTFLTAMHHGHHASPCPQLASTRSPGATCDFLLCERVV